MKRNEIPIIWCAYVKHWTESNSSVWVVNFSFSSVSIASYVDKRASHWPLWNGSKHREDRFRSPRHSWLSTSLLQNRNKSTSEKETFFTTFFTQAKKRREKLIKFIELVLFNLNFIKNRTKFPRFLCFQSKHQPSKFNNFGLVSSQKFLFPHEN